MKSAKLLLLALGLLAVPAFGEATVGDAPQIQFVAADGTPIDLTRLHGKIVVVDFWATWCGPCMAEAGHMVKINQTYADKGLQIIGISLDSDRTEMVQVAKEKGFAWPQYFDGMGWQNKFALQFGIHGIPSTMIIDPDGKVLWTGHPSTIDEPLAQAFKDHPPQLVDPKVMESAQAVLEQINAKLAAGDAKRAIQLMAKIPEGAKADPKFLAQLQTTQKSVESAADKMLAEVPPLIESGNYVEASVKLKQLSSALASTSAGDRARKQLVELMSRPEAKQAIADADKKSKSEAALAEARKLQADKKDSLAYPRFKQIVSEFGGTEAAGVAAKAVQTYEADPAFMKHQTEAAATVKAKAALSMASTYLSAGRNDLAIQKYRWVVEQFPGTSWAETASTALKELANQ